MWVGNGITLGPPWDLLGQAWAACGSFFFLFSFLFFSLLACFGLSFFVVHALHLTLFWGLRGEKKTARIKAPSVHMNPGKAQAQFWNQEGLLE